MSEGQPGAYIPKGPERTAAVLSLILVGVLWSTAGVLIKLVPWSPLAIWSARSAIAAVVLIAVARPSWRGITRHELGAGLALAATTALFVAANKYTSAANAILIQYSSPAWVALLGAWLLRERASRADWLTIAAALFGVVLFFLDRLTFAHTFGNLLAVAAGVAFAGHAVLVRKLALLGQSTLRAIILGHVLAALLGAPALVGEHALAFDGLAAILALGLLQQALPGLAYAWAMRRVTAMEGMLLPTVEPILSPVWVWLVFDEQPGRWALLGGAIVVGAVTARAALAIRLARRPAGA